MNLEFCTLEDLEGNCDENEVDGHAYPDPYYKDVLELLHKKGGVYWGLTPAENIIVYTVRRVDGPSEITVEGYASQPPSTTHCQHQADDDRAEAIDTPSEFSEMCWNCYTISQIWKADHVGYLRIWRKQ